MDDLRVCLHKVYRPFDEARPDELPVVLAAEYPFALDQRVAYVEGHELADHGPSEDPAEVWVPVHEGLYLLVEGTVLDDDDLFQRVGVHRDEGVESLFKLVVAEVAEEDCSDCVLLDEGLVFYIFFLSLIHI